MPIPRRICVNDAVQTAFATVTNNRFPDSVLLRWNRPVVMLAAVLFLSAPAAHAQVMTNDPTDNLTHGTSPFAASRAGQLDVAEPVTGKGHASDAGKKWQPKMDATASVDSRSPELPQMDVDAVSGQDGSAPADATHTATGAAGDPAIAAKAVMVDINSNTLNYDKDRDVYVATGSVHMVISEQNSELFADKMTYDQNQGLVIAEGNVVIVKDGQKTHGSYAKIDLTRKSALINDYLASVEKVSIHAKKALLNGKYVQYENGSIVITPQALQAAGGNRPGQSLHAHIDREDSGEDISRLGEDQMLDAAESSSGTPSKPSAFSMKAHEIDVDRDANGYNKITAKWPAIYYKGHKVFTQPSNEISYDEPSSSVQYLGPDIGYDPDYGGFHLGPSFDFRAGQHGSIRISPIVSFGGSGQRIHGGETFKRNSNGPGIGGIIHYVDPKTQIDAGYNSHVGYPLLLAQRKLFDGKTKLTLSANEDYVAGSYLGYERPRYGAMLSDTRKIASFGKFRVDSFESIGAFKDEFFPTNQKDFFVKPKANDPVYAGRVQLQATLRNTEPLVRVGKFLDFGARADVAAAGYTTGDLVGVVRGGPTMNLRVLGDRFVSNNQYYYAVTAGDTPFVFDSYYRGRQNLVTTNTVKINNYFSIGMRSNLSIEKDNATDSLFTGNSIFVLVGPKDFKVRLAYDVIRRRSYFGLNFFPGQNSQNVDFDTMQVMQPDNYNSMTAPK